MSKTRKIRIPNPNAPLRERLDAGPTIRHKNHMKPSRSKNAGWDAYYAEQNDAVVEMDEFVSDYDDIEM